MAKKQIVTLSLSSERFNQTGSTQDMRLITGWKSLIIKDATLFTGRQILPGQINRLKKNVEAYVDKKLTTRFEPYVAKFLSGGRKSPLSRKLEPSKLISGSNGLSFGGISFEYEGKAIQGSVNGLTLKNLVGKYQKKARYSKGKQFFHVTGRMSQIFESNSAGIGSKLAGTKINFTSINKGVEPKLVGRSSGHPTYNVGEISVQVFRNQGGLRDALKSKGIPNRGAVEHLADGAYPGSSLNVGQILGANNNSKALNPTFRPLLGPLLQYWYYSVVPQLVYASLARTRK